MRAFWLGKASERSFWRAFWRKKGSARSRRGHFGAVFGAVARLVEKIGSMGAIGSGAVAGAVGAPYRRVAALKGGARRW